MFYEVKMLRLKCAVQNYEWGKPGSTSKVAQLSGAADEQAKYAELWMGVRRHKRRKVSPILTLILHY